MFVVFLLIAAGMGSRAYLIWDVATTVLQQQLAAMFGIGAVVALGAAVVDIWAWRMSGRLGKLQDAWSRRSEFDEER